MNTNAAANMFIAEPLKVGGMNVTFLNHPPIPERGHRLEGISRTN